ncbi:MAG: hypothetical protein ACRC9T_03120, partial [Vibrionaceae bacterium]
MLFSIFGKTASAAWQIQSKNCCPASQVSADVHAKAQHHKKEHKKPAHKHKKCKKGSSNVCYEKQDCIQNCNSASHGQKLAFFAHDVKKLAP